MLKKGNKKVTGKTLLTITRYTCDAWLESHPLSSTNVYSF